MNLIIFLKSLVSNTTSPTAAQWQAIRNDAIKLAGICGLLVAGVKAHEITMSPGLQNILQYVVIAFGASAAHAQSAINTSAAPATPPADGPAS